MISSIKPRREPFHSLASKSIADALAASIGEQAGAVRRSGMWSASGMSAKGGADTGPSPVDRRKTGSKHHLICDGRGTPLKVITTAANVNDVTQTLALVDGIPPVAGRPGRPRRRPDSLLGDKGYDSNSHREELRKRRILPVISRKGSPNIKGLGKLRYVVEQTFALLHQFKRLAVRWERRTELHDAFVSLACALICWRRLKKHRS
ncbi:IS5 family transposase [Streptomyces canus]|uniref:IS5 family transposase n=1 Tax=Streptomyces canus TaxID=58343 RepID=UPI002255E43F|nr:IS5 family transposase [Streptomyces canus]MCX5261769.1 IS5 family transposase [Streptomyces canus]